MIILVMNVLLLIFNAGFAGYHVEQKNFRPAIIHMICLLINFTAIILSLPAMHS